MIVIAVAEVPISDRSDKSDNSDRSDAAIVHPKDAIQLAPGRGSQSRRPAGYEAPHISRPLWSHLHRLVRPQGSIIILPIRFPLVVRGRLPPPTRGLAEWHPVGCGGGTYLLLSMLLKIASHSSSNDIVLWCSS